MSVCALGGGGGGDGGGDARRVEARIPENQGEFCFKKVWC